MKDTGLHIAVKKSTYGLYVNGIKIDREIDINQYDFFSIADFYFYYRDGKLYSDSSNNMIIHRLSYSGRDNRDKNLYPRFNLNTRVRTVIPAEPIQVLDPPERPEQPKDNLIMSIAPAFVMLMLTIVIRGFMSNTGSTFVIFSAYRPFKTAEDCCKSSSFSKIYNFQAV